MRATAMFLVSDGPAFANQPEIDAAVADSALGRGSPSTIRVDLLAAHGAPIDHPVERIGSGRPALPGLGLATRTQV